MSKESRFRVPGLPGSPFTRALALALFASLSASAAFAAWVPAGAPLSNASGAQSSLRAVTDGRGGFIAAWIDTNGGVPRLLAQRVDSTGATQWTAGGVQVTTNTDSLKQVVAASDGQNGLLIAWTARSAPARYQVFAQRLNASGSAQWTAGGMRVDPASNDTLQGLPAIIASDQAGGAFVAWNENRGATDYDVYVQRISSTGTLEWTTGGVDVNDADTDNQANPKLLSDGIGGAWVSWEDLSATPHTYFQHYNDVGTGQWASSVTPTNVSTPSLTAFMGRLRNVSDTLLVVWTETSPNQIQAALLTPATGVFALTSTIRSTSALPFGLVMQPASSSILGYVNANTVFATGISATAGVSTVERTLASGQVLDATTTPRLVGDGGAGAYATWSSNDSVYARHIAPTVASDWAGSVVLGQVATPVQNFPVAVGGTDLLAAWIDGRNAGTTGDDLYMQRVAPNGVTGTYYRIDASIGGGTGTFTAGGGRTWVREHLSQAVRWAGTGGYHTDHVLVGGANLGAIPNYTFTDITADSSLQAFFANTPVTTTVTAPAGGYRAFSLPGTPSPASVASNFANLMPYDTMRWRLGHWEPDSNRYVEPNSGLTNLAGMTGYWFAAAKDTSLSVSIPSSALTEAQVSLPLKRSAAGQGWNQFGSPFLLPLAFSQLRLSTMPVDSGLASVTNTYTDHQVLEWNPGTSAYDPATLLLPGHAYWLWRQSATAVSLVFPFTFDPVQQGSSAQALTAGGDWSVGLLARAGTREARLSFGTANVESGRWNGLSAHALPAGPGDALSLVAHVEDWGDESGAYRSVFRPDAAELHYEFDASAPAGLAETALTFAFDRLPSDRRVVLSEPATGWSREVTANASVPLVLSANVRHLRLEVLAGAPVTPNTPRATALRAVGPNPFRDAATLSFSIAHAGPLRWDVFDLAGRRVASGARTLEVGEHTLTWDGRDAAGVRLRPGLYLVRWQADGTSGATRLVLMD